MSNDNPTQDATDISDVRTDTGTVSTTQALNPLVLPIRGEKRIVPAPVSPSDAAQIFQQQWAATGQKSPNQHGYDPTGRTSLVEQQDYYLRAAMSPYIDYVYIRLAHRGIGQDKKADGSLPAVYRFLINPSQVSVTRQTLDAQTMTRSGWQIGVWGEDSLSIQLNGKTAGQYWAFGITDRYQPFTESYRNLIMLQQVHENNGYFFEGETVNEGPLAAGFTRRRIKMHEDVELTVGNFVWLGMFESLTITQNAEEPWIMAFNMNFVAWTERFRPGSPYQNEIRSVVQRGHSYSAWNGAAASYLKGAPANAAAVQTFPPSQSAAPASSAPAGLPPAVTSSVAVSQGFSVDRAFVSDPQANDFSLPPTESIFTNTQGLNTAEPNIVSALARSLLGGGIG